MSLRGIFKWCRPLWENICPDHGFLYCPPWPLYHDDINPRPNLENLALALAFNNQIMSALALTSPWIAAVSNPSFPTIQWADKIQRHPTEPWIKQMWWLNFLQGWYIEIGEGWRKMMRANKDSREKKELSLCQEEGIEMLRGIPWVGWQIANC